MERRESSVLFVCYGNIMRSAFAEVCFRRQGPEFGCASAGVAAREGERAEVNARAMARKLGFSLEQHRSQRVSASLVAGSGRIYLMDSLNEEMLLRQFPEAAAKTEYLGSLLEKGPREIEDPYLLSAKELERCFRRIEEAVTEVARRMRQGN